MTIPTYSELRAAVQAAATELGHPTKVPTVRYGRVVYFDGGHVGGLFDDEYLIAEGDDHQDSILALARHLGITHLNNDVTVSEVTAGHFWLRCAGK